MGASPIVPADESILHRFFCAMASTILRVCLVERVTMGVADEHSTSFERQIHGDYSCQFVPPVVKSGLSIAAIRDIEGQVK